MEYYYKPRKVEAAQWDPEHPGDVFGMLANHNIRWETCHDGGLNVDPVNDGLSVHPTDWVVITEYGPDVFTDDLFHHWFAPQPTRGRTVRNTVVGNVSGMIIQSGGTLRM